MRTGRLVGGFTLLSGAIIITIYLWVTKGMMIGILVGIASSLALLGGIIIGKSLTTSRIASLLKEEISEVDEDGIAHIIERFKRGLDSAKPLADLAMHLEEVMDRETAARVGAAYLLATLPIFEISLEVISPRGDKEVISTVWGDREKPENSRRIVLQKKDAEDNVLILSITTDEEHARETTEIGMQVLEIIIRRWNNLIKMYTDPLTGARNRGYLPVLMQRLRGHTESIAVFMIDLDHFKEVNDTLGHEEGDKVLVEVVNRIKKVLRSGDEIIRYGGDEFVIVIKDVGLRVTYSIADRIRKAIANPPIVKEIPVTVSIGVAYKMKNIPFEPEKALKIADEALYKAKEKRNTYYIFEAA
ncbi:diguanylate cyclase [bacterium 3DAC]|nr:diguanylate cyclase [bacterium 3DAC]